MLIKKIQDFIEKIENIDITFLGGVFLLFIIMFFRTFLENYANSLNLYHMSGIIDTFFHYPLWFSIIFLSIFIITQILTKEKIAKIAKIITIFSLVLITPPIIDLIFNKIHQTPYIFIIGNYSELFKSFITYLGGGAVGIGIRTEVAFALFSLGFYIFYKTKKIKKAFLGIFLLYSTIFVMLAIPTFIFSIQNKITNEYPLVNKSNIIDFWYNKEPINAITANRTFILEHNNYSQPDFYPSSITQVLNQNSITLSIILLIINVILLGWCLFLYSSKKFFVVVKNFRYLRIIHYFIMVSIGIYWGIKILERNPIGSLFDLMSFISLFLAILFAWLFAVWENDEVDIEIDKISNQNRPLVEEGSQISLEEWGNLKFIFLTFSLMFAFLNGLYSFIFILLFIFIYHIYSTPPLKLKRFLGISSLLIGINALLAVLIGFFLSAGTENLSAFPVKYTFGILGIFLLVENVKNIKDIEGDRKEGIKTLPVLLGEKLGKLIVGFCLFFGALLVPFIFYLNLYTFWLAIFFGLILFFLTNKQNFKEKYIFLAYFVYIIIFFIIIKI